MNKHITVLLHIGVWLGLFLMPLMMVHHDDDNCQMLASLPTAW